ncbi:MAG TPA: tetratricopeptide repeat protein, partial [Candidatus Krumholzibacteria bacterium]|nr:tetratricopeptide repeat protein [Candidatus Krumholzibacteria bacterium]
GRKLDARSDLFSLATIFHEMLTGMHPFRGEHPMAVMYSIRNETPKPLKLQSGDFPVGLQGAIDRAFEKEVDKRYADADAFRDAILAVAPELTGTTVVERKSSPVRMALLVGIVSTVVVGIGIGGWNVVQKSRAAANRTAAKNLNQRAMNTNDPVLQEDLLRQAIEKDPTFEIPYNNLGYIAESNRNFFAADSLYRQAVRLNPHYSGGLHNIGNRFFQNERYDSAVVYYRRALRGDGPDSSRTGNQLAAVLIRQQRPTDAKEVIAVVLPAAKDADVRGYLLMNLGKALAAEGDSTAARARWREAMEIYPNIPELRELLGS